MTVLNAPLGRCLVVLLALTIVVGCESKSGETQETPTGQEGPPNAGPLEGEDVAQGPVQGEKSAHQGPSAKLIFSALVAQEVLNYDE